MINYSVITENDVSKWKDKTGEEYHFPKKYLKILQPGTQVIYYKGRMKDKKFADKRLSLKEHYFGVAVIGELREDAESEKGDYYATVVNFQSFHKSVPFKIENKNLEIIPESRRSNYYRDGVRPISKEIFERIISLSDLSINYNDDALTSNGFDSEVEEGGKKKRYTTYYERNHVLRQQVLEIHGYTCQACKLNFKEYYGNWGEGFIHVHHLRPISSIGETHKVNPRTDMAVLCPNCHSMVHRRKDKILTIEELKHMIKKR